MLFNSSAFLIFFISLLAVTAISPQKWIKAILIIASIIFYAHWYPPYLILLLLSVVINYWFCLRIRDYPETAKRNLIICVILNLTVLFGFKYVHFFSSALGIALPEQFRWALPLGISFYTFEAIACVVDIYKGARPKPFGLPDFLFFVNFFPHLIAGPIFRIKNDWDHLMHPVKPNFSRLNQGLYLVFWGLIKKMLIADNLSIFVGQCFDNPGNYGALTLWIGIYAFAVQIYCDFSGYVDTGIGLAKVFGLELPDNFNGPYLSQSITEFWRRWHITLSNWLRDFLYIPLGGNRQGEIRTYINLMLTMLLGGLWHGANWTFVIWGGLHGAYLSIEKLLSQHFGLKLIEDKNKFSLRIFAQQVICFHLVCLAWVFFRAINVEAAFTYIASMLSNSNTLLDTNSLYLQSFIIMVIALAFHLLNRRFQIKANLHTWRLEFRMAFLLLAIILLLVFGVKQEVRFIYFDF